MNIQRPPRTWSRLAYSVLAWALCSFPLYKLTAQTDYYIEASSEEHALGIMYDEIFPLVDPPSTPQYESAGYPFYINIVHDSQNGYIVAQIEEWTLNNTYGSWNISPSNNLVWSDDVTQSSLWESTGLNDYSWAWGTWSNTLSEPIVNVNWLATVHISINNGPYIGALYKKPSPWAFSLTPNASRADVESMVAQEFGVPQLNPMEKKFLNMGCVGLAKVMHRRKIIKDSRRVIRYPIEDYPEQAPVDVYGEVKAFLTEADMDNWKHPSGVPWKQMGYIEVIYVKVGYWKNNQVPLPIPLLNEVPIDSVTNIQDTSDATPEQTTVNNFITKVQGHWVKVNRGYRVERGEDVSDQQFEVSQNLVIGNTQLAYIFVKRVMEAHLW